MIDRILDKLGIELNDMQQDAMQAVLHTDRDVVVLSPTGRGKTLAYLLRSRNSLMRATTSRRLSW